jgi:hypothetical protein
MDVEFVEFLAAADEDSDEGDPFLAFFAESPWIWSSFFRDALRLLAAIAACCAPGMMNLELVDMQNVALQTRG